MPDTTEIDIMIKLLESIEALRKIAKMNTESLKALTETIRLQGHSIRKLQQGESDD